MRELIDHFEKMGFATITDSETLDAFMFYVARYNVPMSTSLNRDDGTVTVQKQPFGTHEVLGLARMWGAFKI